MKPSVLWRLIGSGGFGLCLLCGSVSADIVVIPFDGCTSTMELGRCCDEEIVTTMCNDGQGPLCTSKRVTCGEWSLVMITSIGLDDAHAYWCKRTIVRKACESPEPGEPEQCVPKQTTEVWVLGAEATGGPCGIEHPE